MTIFTASLSNLKILVSQSHDRGEVFILAPTTCRSYVSRRHTIFTFYADDSRSVAYSTRVLNPNITVDEWFRKTL